MGQNTDVDHVNEAMNKSVADEVKVPNAEQAIQKLGINMQMAFIDADAFIADPYALLGQVLQVRKVDGKCPSSLSDGGFSAELTPFPVPRKINEASKLAQPTLRQSIMVDFNLSTSVSFLSYLSAQFSADTSFSLMVFDQAAGLIDTTDKDWRPGLVQWKLDNDDLIKDPEICYLFAVAGFIQKNIVRKEYKKYKGKVSGAAYGVNINGELSTGTDQYSLDIKFGLTPIVIKRPAPALQPNRGFAAASKKAAFIEPSLSEDEYKLFTSATGGRLDGNTLKSANKV